MPKYKLIFFDADETLFDYKRCEENAICLTLNELTKCAISRYPAIYKFYTETNSALWKLYHAGEITKEYLLKVRFDRLIEKFDLPINSQIFSTQYLFNLSNQHFLIQGVEEVIKELSKHCKLAIITNGVSSVHHGRLSNSVLEPYISGLFVSGDHHGDSDFQKPNSKIFEYAHLNTDALLSKDKIIMVGDSLSSDIAGGINYGIDTCWLNEGHSVNNSNHQPTYEIFNMDELLKIIQ